MGTCLDRGIKVVSNAGGLDPGGCADAVREVAERLGLAPDDRLRRRRRPDAPPPRPPRHQLPPPLRSIPCRSAFASDSEWRAAKSDTNEGISGIRTGSSRRMRISGASGSSRRWTGAPTSSSPGGSPTPPSPAARRHGTTAGSGRLRPARGRGRGRPRDRVQRAGDGRQLLVLPRDRGSRRGRWPGTVRVPVGRGCGRRVVGDRQARRHRGSGHRRHGHVAVALRDHAAPSTSAPT